VKIWPFTKGARQPPQIDEDRWTVGQGTYQGRAMIVRLNKGVSNVMARQDFSYRVGIAVPFRRPNQRGFPPREEMKALEQIEIALDAALEHDRETVHVATITTSGMREFLFYTRNTEHALAKVATVRAATKSHELQAIVVEDRDWSVYKELAL
jgi:hypothetical protein